MTHEMTNFVILFKKTPQVCLRGPTGLPGAGELHCNPLIPCWVHPQHPLLCWGGPCPLCATA